MDIQMMEQLIRQNEMKDFQIKQAGVDGIINMEIITEYLHQGGILRPIPLPSAFWITYNGMVYMFI